MRILKLIVLLGMLSFSLAAHAQQSEGENSQAGTLAANVAVSDGDLQLLILPARTSDLSELAEIWQSHLKTQIEDNVRLNFELAKATADESADVRSEIIVVAAQQSAVLGKYRIVLSEWQRKGANPDELVLHTKYADVVQAEMFRVTDPRALFSIAREWMFSVKGGFGFLIKVVSVVLAFFGMTLVARFVRRMAGRAIERIPSVSNLLKAFVLKVVYWITLGVGIVLVLAMVGVNVAPVFAVFGGISFILAFALQDTLGNLASGLMIMVLKPFDTGDFIQVAGLSGIVDDVSIIATTIRTFDNQIIVVPNSKVWGDVITNVNAAPTRRVDMVFGIAYTDSADHAIAVLTKLVEENDLCLTDPAPGIFVGELADSSVNIFCRPWVKTADYWTVYWDLLSRAKAQFDAEGISIPFPQQDVHIHQVAAPKDG